MRIWVCSTGVDIIVISETLTLNLIWMKIIDSFNIYCSDHPRRGGVAIYVRSSLTTQMVFASSAPKQFEILALNVDLSFFFFLGKKRRKEKKGLKKKKKY